MPPLIATGFGNRRVDIFGNTHVRFHDRGGALIRDAGAYRGRHRRPYLNPLIRLGLRWEGFNV